MADFFTSGMCLRLARTALGNAKSTGEEIVFLWGMSNGSEFDMILPPPEKFWTDCFATDDPYTFKFYPNPCRLSVVRGWNNCG